HDFGLTESTSVNWTHYRQLTELLSLVPLNDPYVLFQNDMPEVLPRPLPSFLHGTPLTVFGDWLNNSQYDAINNQYPLRLPGGDVVVTPIDYALYDPSTVWGSVGASSANTSMTKFVEVMFDSGRYGILGSVGGMILLQRGYNGTPAIYEPAEVTYSASQMFSGTTFAPPHGNIITVGNLSNQSAWFGPFTTLNPGKYQVRYSLSTDNTSPTNHIRLLATANFGATVLGWLDATGRNFSAPNVWTTITFPINVTKFYDAVEFPSYLATWHGTLSIRYVQIVQMAPP
ncbi:MAG: hypothetical protein L3J97_04125, partial [Thermoplasmata archaeon]|nr:hypothetical protein [Thermoplasmata archaeon]